MVDLVALALLGRHELGGPDDETGAGRVLVAPKRLGDTEIEHEASEIRSHEDVRGLDVAVHDPCLVRRVERFRDLAYHFDGAFQRPGLP